MRWAAVALWAWATGVVAEAPIPVEVVRVYDGDTFTVNLPCDMPVLCRGVPVRLRGIDTPEIRGQCREEIEAARAARARVREVLTQGPVVLVQVGRDKYFRVLARAQVGDVDLADDLITQGLARPYDGGSKQGWCP